MKRIARDQPMRASLLDRLQAGASERCGKNGCQDLSQLIASVHDHLEALLNTRWRVGDWDESYGELKHSLVQYGIPDFTPVSAASPEGRRNLQEALREAIRQHEPRFLNVQVEILDADDIRSIRFRIHGELHAYPEPAHVAFDSLLDAADQRIEVNDSDHV